MSNFMKVYQPAEEGILYGFLKLGKAINNTAGEAQAEKRDKEDKVVFILEDNYKNKDWNDMLYAWNEEDAKHVIAYHGIKRQIKGSDINDDKKIVVMPESSWNKYKDSKILTFSVKRSDCKKQKDIVTRPFVSFIYRTSKDKLGSQKKAVKVRDLIKQLGYKVTTPWHGPLKPGKPLS